VDTFTRGMYNAVMICLKAHKTICYIHLIIYASFFNELLLFEKID